MNFNNNPFDDELPSIIFTIPNIQRVSFHGCAITGRLPTSTLQQQQQATSTTISKLTNLDLSNNDLGVGSLGGDFPTEIGYLQQLEYLNLSYNRFSDVIPAEIGH